MSLHICTIKTRREWEHAAIACGKSSVSNSLLQRDKNQQDGILMIICVHDSSMVNRAELGHLLSIDLHAFILNVKPDEMLF